MEQEERKDLPISQEIPIEPQAPAETSQIELQTPQTAETSQIEPQAPQTTALPQILEEVQEVTEPEKKRHQYLQELSEFNDTLSTHKCSECKKVFVYGEWQEITRGGKKKEPYFLATRPSRKGITHQQHQMLEGDQAPENYFARWDSDKVHLEELIKQGKNIDEMAEILGRTPAAINTMIYKTDLREMFVLRQKQNGRKS
jgi:hypothetical protein